MLPWKVSKIKRSIPECCSEWFPLVSLSVLWKSFVDDGKFLECWRKIFKKMECFLKWLLLNEGNNTRMLQKDFEGEVFRHVALKSFVDKRKSSGMSDFEYKMKFSRMDPQRAEVYPLGPWIHLTPLFFSTQVVQGETEAPSFSWTYEEIKEVHKRWWQLRDNAVEIFLTNGRTLLLAFDNTKVRGGRNAEWTREKLQNSSREWISVSLWQKPESIKRTELIMRGKYSEQVSFRH